MGPEKGKIKPQVPVPVAPSKAGSPPSEFWMRELLKNDTVLREYLGTGASAADPDDSGIKTGLVPLVIMALHSTDRQMPRSIIIEPLHC
jgi:hypothetical protein